jgi:thermostable 8-oxoguanine DNA glycosylase
MIAANKLVPYRKTSEDYSLTEQLKSRLEKLRKERKPFYLTANEFDEILQWKLRGQYARQRKRRKANTDKIIREVTKTAFSLTHQNKEYETELKLGILTSLRGVGVPVASAVLALAFPDEYAVIDYRGWRQVFGEEKNSFSIPDYKKYMSMLRKLANELNWPVQEVDLAIWAYDKEN